jgi:phage repressor protein C with HTH and peptisase S24 domain
MPERQKQAKNPIVARIDQEIARLGSSRQKVSKDAGLDRGFLQKLEKRGPSASTYTDNLKALAAAARIPLQDLLAVSPTPPQAATPTAGEGMTEVLSRKQIPILGLVAGSLVGSFSIAGPPIGFVPAPPALERVPGAYAVYVQNESMSPLHSQGDLRFVHPFKPPKPGDSVILQVRNSDGEADVFIKIFVSSSPDWLICRQLNPAAEVRYPRSQIVGSPHRVLTVNEMFNG